MLNGIPREHLGIPLPTSKARYPLSLLADVDPNLILESSSVESVSDGNSTLICVSEFYWSNFRRGFQNLKQVDLAAV